jgi:phosphate transport system substrate-binding protein
MKNVCWILLPIMGAVAQVAFSSENVKLSGAASVVDSLVEPHKEAVEKATGYKLIIDKNNAGKGLIDLINGKCDAAMTSASLEATIQAATSAGLDRAFPEMQTHVIKKSEVVFIVHPTNTVKSLSWGQIRDIHAGLISNWKEVGGKDLPITVYTDAKASATRGLIKQVVMGGSEYAAAAKAVDFVKQVNDRVAQDESAIGGLGLGFVEPGKVSVIVTDKVERPLGFITIGAPSEKVRKVIDAFRAVSGS